MYEIMSNQTVIQNIIERLDHSVQSVVEHDIDFAEHTTVNGNIRAKELMEVEKKLVREFILSLQQDIERIQNIASEFSHIDQTLGDGYTLK